MDRRVFAEAFRLYGTRLDHSLTDLCRRFTGLSLGDVLERYRRDLALNVDTVHKWAADLIEVFLYLSRRAHTVMRRIAIVAARTGVH